MFDVEVNFEDIQISSIQKEDVVLVQEWMKEQMDRNPEVRWTNVEELQDRFLEYYISENEFFLKVLIDKKIIGIFKGRVEFKSPNEVLIWCFIIDDKYRGKGLGSGILEEVLKYFRKSLGINIFSTGIIDGSDNAIKFWRKNQFSLYRISKSFFNVEGKERDMLILKREEKVRGI